MPAPFDPDPRARRLRWFGGAMIAAALVGVLLAANLIYSQGAAREAAEAMLRQEAGGWMRALLSQLRGTSTPLTGDVLQAFVDQGSAEGLRFAAIVSERGVQGAGTPAGGLGPEQITLDTPHWVGGRVRFAVNIRPSRGRLPRHPFGPIRDPERPRVHPTHLVEFEPQAYPRLIGDARRTLALGSVTAGLVVLLAASGFVSMRRRLALEQESERERNLARLGEMSAVLAHEIRNPLASLKGHAQLLLEAAGDPAVQTKARRVVDEAVRIERITSDLLDFVREGPIERVATDLAALVREIAAEVVPDGRALLGLPAVPLRLELDPHRLRQAIENVVRNAVQAGPGAIEIELAAAEQTTLRVRDHGPGIPPDQLEQIFEPFVTTRTRGTGLGLAIARRLVERQGGRLEAGNHPGGGAVFSFILPRPSG